VSVPAIVEIWLDGPPASPARITGTVHLYLVGLDRAFGIGDANQIKLKPLDDPDLEPLWADIADV